MQRYKNYRARYTFCHVSIGLIGISTDAFPKAIPVLSKFFYSIVTWLLILLFDTSVRTIARLQKYIYMSFYLKRVFKLQNFKV